MSGNGVFFEEEFCAVGGELEDAVALEEASENWEGFEEREGGSVWAGAALNPSGDLALDDHGIPGECHDNQGKCDGGGGKNCDLGKIHEGSMRG
jgi:hypothetical protein